MGASECVHSAVFHTSGAGVELHANVLGVPSLWVQGIVALCCPCVPSAMCIMCRLLLASAVGAAL
eukprot:13896497-Alexandrium_andersonii.AAC.1